MKSFGGKMMLAAACAGLTLVLAAGNASAGDRDHRGGYDRGRSGHYDRGHDRDYGRSYDRDRHYRPHYSVGRYYPVRPVYVSRPCYVYERPCVEYYPVYRSYYRPSYGIGLYFGW